MATTSAASEATLCSPTRAEVATDSTPAQPASPAHLGLDPTSMLTFAVKAGDLKMVELIAEQSAEAVCATDDKDGATALHWAAMLGHLSILEHLAQKGAPIDAVVESTGMQPIHWACTRGHVDVVKRLLALGAKIDALDIKQTTPLAIAAQYDHTFLVFYLVRERADINLLDHCQDSALHWAAYKGNQQTVSLLHYLGLPADAADAYGSTALHLATGQVNQSSTHPFFQMSHASLPVYHRMCFFTVFFHCPPPQGNANVVEYLLESTDGESLMLRKDNKGRTPLDLASKSGHAHVLRVINAFRPTGFQRLLQLGTGKGGEASCFCTCLFLGRGDSRGYSSWARARAASRNKQTKKSSPLPFVF